MEKKFKNSEKRNEILKALKETTTHPSAEWIYQRVRLKYPNIGIATVYRNLKLLLEQNLIFKVDVGDGIDHFDANTKWVHGHMYCIRCGSIYDMDTISESQLNELARDSFTVEAYSLVFYGVCKNCKQEENS